MPAYEDQQSALRAQVPTGTPGALELQNQGFKDVGTAPTSTGFTANFTSPVSAVDLASTTTSPFVPEDTRKLLSDLRAGQVRIASLIQPSEHEKQLQNQIGALQSGLEATTQNLEYRPGLDLFTFNRGISQAERETQQRLAPLQRQLGVEQGARTTQLEGEKFQQQGLQNQLDIIRQFENTALQRQQLVQNQVNTLRDDARSIYNSVLDSLKGLTWEQLDPNRQNQLRNLGRNVGLDEGLIKVGLQATHDALLAKQKEANLTSDIKEYNFAQAQGYKGTFADYLKLKATQFGTENQKESIVDKTTKVFTQFKSAGLTRSQIEEQWKADNKGAELTPLVKKTLDNLFPETVSAPKGPNVFRKFLNLFK